MDSESNNVVSKKIEGARKVNTPIPRLNDVLGELTRKIEKTARNYLGTVVEAMILEVETKRFSDVLDAISMPAMIGIVEVDGVDRASLVNMDLDLVYHVVDLRMGGLPSELPEFAARRPTSIDTAMCIPMVDIALEGFTSGLSTVMGAEDTVPMSCGHFEHVPMLANIAPESSDVLCVQVSLDIGEAARSGNFELVVPFSTIDMILARLKTSETVATDAASNAWGAHMREVVLDTEIELMPVLHSAFYSVAELSRLEVGQVIELQDNAHRSLTVNLDMMDEQIPIAKARLGAFKGGKALKLSTEPDQAFLSPLKRHIERASGT